jgi:TetR/AcrR family transcriptional repressor of nem operon
MRYSRERKAEVHGKIVQDASRRLRNEGLTGAAVTAVMKDAGLTHGGFYKHFASKDDLLVESLHAAFAEIAERLARIGENARPGEAWKAIVKEYLSLKHCEHVDYGCPLAALGPDLARAKKGMRARIAREMRRYRERIAPYMPGRKNADKERNFLVIISTMIGAIAIARILPDRPGRKRVLAGARDFLLQSFEQAGL